jgi:hypothetical protein
LDDHAFGYALPRIAALAAGLDAKKALNLLARSLAGRIQGEASHHRSLATSGIWRPKIEEPEFGDSHADEALIDQLIRVGRQVLAADPSAASEVREQLATTPPGKRVASLLLSELESPDSSSLAAAILDPEQFRAFLGEYQALVARQYPHLSDADKAAFLEMVAKGPDALGPDIEADTASRRFRIWQYRRLAVLRGHLREPEAELLNVLTTEFGDLPPERASSELWVGPTAPVSEEWLAARTPQEVSTFLKAWHPPGGFMADSPEGLARRVQSVVARDAARYSAFAPDFKDLHATYVRAVIAGLKDGLSGGAAIDWEATLQLASVAVGRPRDDPGSFGSSDPQFDVGDVDPHWGWARREVATLLETGLELPTAGMTPTAAVAAWPLIDAIVEDPEPDREYEMQYGLQNMDWSTLALNTVRPRGIAALLALWIWLRTNDASSELLPEIRQRAAQHLSTTHDPSLAVRATIGRAVPLLLTHDRQWLEDHLQDVFPVDDTKDDFDWASWSAYLTFWRPHPETFQFLRDRYRRAIGDLGNEPEWRWIRNPSEALGQHLVGLYASGLAAFEEWLLPFFDRASVAVRASIMSWIGRSPNPDDEIAGRLIRLWNELMSRDRNPSNDELATFGWWFASGHYDAGWSLATLENVLSRNTSVEADHAVVPRLEELSTSHPVESVRCLLLLVRGVSETWRILGWADAIESIVRQAAASGSTQASQDAHEVISLLAIRHGQTRFRTLLE